MDFALPAHVQRVGVTNGQVLTAYPVVFDHQLFVVQGGLGFTEADHVAFITGAQDQQGFSRQAAAKARVQGPG